MGSDSIFDTILNSGRAAFNFERRQDIIIDDADLWCKVLKRAKLDLYMFPRWHPNNPLNWFLSQDDEIGTFLWICESYSLPADCILKEFMTRIVELMHSDDKSSSSTKLHSDEQLKRLLS